MFSRHKYDNINIEYRINVVLKELIYFLNGLF